MKIRFFLPPLFYIIIAQAGRRFTAQGLDTWFPTLIKPVYAPPGGLISVIWTVVYIFAAASLIIFISRAKTSSVFWPVILLYVVNGVLNVFWSLLFFALHLLGPGVFVAAVLAATAALIMVKARRYSYLAAVLLMPYFLWACFTTYLAYDIFRLN